jgi:hypothetical protein
MWQSEINREEKLKQVQVDIIKIPPSVEIIMRDFELNQYDAETAALIESLISDSKLMVSGLDRDHLENTQEWFIDYAKKRNLSSAAFMDNVDLILTTVRSLIPYLLNKNILDKVIYVTGMTVNSLILTSGYLFVDKTRDYEEVI